MNNFKVESDFMYKGYRCVVIFTHYGYRCGFVGSHFEDIVFKKYCDNLCEEDYISIHGGIAYANTKLGFKSYPVQSELQWLGFHCGHYGDGRDLSLAKEYFNKDEKLLAEIELKIQIGKNSFNLGKGVIRTKEYVEQQCKYLINQIIQNKGE